MLDDQSTAGTEKTGASQNRIFDSAWEAELFTDCPALTTSRALTLFSDRRG